MRPYTLLILLLGLGACSSEAPIVRSDIGVDGDTDVGGCAPELDVTQVTFEDGSTQELVGISNACQAPVFFDLVLDDPDQAFAITVQGQPNDRTIELQPDGFVEVEVALVAQEPGVYEGEIALEMGDQGLGTVQLYAELGE